MRVIVLGSGVIGVTTAWYLAREGYAVTVVERQPAPALETSFANGSQISVSHAEPWANPAAPLRVLGWLGREDAPLLWRLRADATQWAWGLRFLRECLPARTRANVAALVGLGLHSRQSLRELRAELALEYDQLSRGILHFYTDGREFARARRAAETMREFGCERQPVTAAECLAIEPALQATCEPLAGGTFTAGDESGDARLFTERLASHCRRAGVEFRFDTPVAALEQCGQRITGVCLASGERLVADATVVALGSYSPLLLAPLGVKLPIYPAKGYSATFTLTAGSLAPTVSLTDDGYKLVMSRLGARLRVAGTAEFGGYDLRLNEARCAAIVKRVRRVFPSLETTGEVEYWTGLRPATPGNLPYIGSLAEAGWAGLWLATGHGTLGWTLACGTGRLLADMMAGRVPEVDPRPFSWVA